MLLRRRRICHLRIRDAARPDLSALLRGSMALHSSPQAELLSPLDETPIPLSAVELAVLATLPGDRWLSLQEAIDASGASEAEILALLEKSALLGDHEAHRPLVEDEARLTALGWHDLAAVYHRHTRWHDLAAVYHRHTRWHDASGDEATRKHTPDAEARRLAAQAARQGPLPSHFVRHPGPVVELDLPTAGALDDTLRRRETVRRFRTDLRLSRADFEHVLHGVFGITGIRELGAGMAALKRTSPSGGGLTAIEPYVMVLAVDGIASGLYHYRAETHALTLLAAFDVAEGRRRLSHYCAGQAYFGDSHAAILHAARFDRHFWKYVRHGKAYKAVLMDSAHLSQTLYLHVAERGLGAWYTAIVNDAAIAHALDLDPLAMDVVAANGFGIPDGTRRELSFNHVGFDPLEARARLASAPEDAYNRSAAANADGATSIKGRNTS